MPHDGVKDGAHDAAVANAAAALAEARSLLDAARDGLRGRIGHDGPARAEDIDRHQHAAHALAWLATYVEGLGQLQDWASALHAGGRMGEIESLILDIGFGEYLAQIHGGIPMSQGEFARPADFGLASEPGPATRIAMERGADPAARQRLVQLMHGNSGRATAGDCGLDDELEMVRDQFRRFSDERIAPDAHRWHLEDRLIPAPIIEALAGMGVFGLTIPEAHGGAGLGKTAMVVVSEELSRGYLGVGSLGTRAEIAAELILCGGTEAQKARWLPLIASGAVLPTAVFTEPDTGSDLGSLRTRARLDGDIYHLTGAKTWITHAARAGLMTVLARTDPESTDWRGLSMFLAEKTPAGDGAAFPDTGLTGTEIGVLGYRGMKEYELGFDAFPVPAGNLLGGVEGAGFKQLMQTFESARIQTAARAVGVAQSALDAGMAYAFARRQFGQPLAAFPRVAGKLAMMAVEIMIARQLTYHAARRKDDGRRCDLEAGMAKLLGARVAWAAADNAVQIHGGNGFALEYPVSRILCDARILNIFEGAAEIQAQVIARRLLG